MLQNNCILSCQSEINAFQVCAIRNTLLDTNFHCFVFSYSDIKGNISAEMASIEGR